MNAIRWKLFMLISRLGWMICPEPYRTIINSDYERALQLRRAEPPEPSP